MKQFVLLFAAAFEMQISTSQQDIAFISFKDSVSEASKTALPIQLKNNRLSIRSTIVPASLITYGIIAQCNENLRDFDTSVKKLIRKNNSDFHTSIDDYLQYGPAIAVYGLNAIGIKGKSSFVDRSIIYLIANTIMAVPVQSIKKITKVQRPEGFGTNAFPSGHTATAFVAAEFLNQEYKKVSPWYGIAGYITATTTAILRMYNNKHWFRDLFPGAGFGILSTKIAYLIYPSIKRRFFKKKSMDTVLIPYY